MATEVRLRRGTTAQHTAFVGAAGEVTVDTTKKVIVVHDGVTPGGFAAEPSAVLLNRANHTGTQSPATISNLAATTRATTQAQLVPGANMAITPVGDTLVVSSTAPSPIVSIMAYGAVGNGVADDTAAKNAAEAANASVYWPAGTYKLTTPPTLGKSWGVGQPQIAGVQQYLHPQPGPVSEIFATVFNPPANGTGNAQTQLQKAVDFAQANDLPLTLGANAVYRTTAALTFQLGRTGAETKAFNVKLNGNNALFQPAGQFSTIWVRPRSLISEMATGKDVGELELRNFRVDGALFPTASALTIGEAGKWASCGFKFGQVSDILVTGLTNFNAISIVETRMFSFNNVVVRGGGLSIVANTANSFAGDAVFTACEFGADNYLYPALSIMAGVSASTNAQCRGIHFHGCFFYKTESRLISAGTSSLVADVFFTDCQWDAGLTGVPAITTATQASGSIDGIHFIHPYIVQWSAQAIRCSTAGSGKTTNIFIEGAKVGMITGAAAVFDCQGIQGATVSNNRFTNCTSSAGTINFDACTDVMITGNISTGTAAAPPSGVLIGNASTRYTIANNLMRGTMANLVNDYSSGTPERQVVNNLKVA